MIDLVFCLYAVHESFSIYAAQESCQMLRAGGSCVGEGLNLWEVGLIISPNFGGNRAFLIQLSKFVLYRRPAIKARG